MQCPYCLRQIEAFTGLQEAQKFQKHLAKCRKNPENTVLTDGKKTVVVGRGYSLSDALELRAKSGQ